MTINISIKFLTLPVLPSQQQKPHRNGIWNKSSKICLLSRSCSSSHRAIPLKPPSLSIKIFIINVTREREKAENTKYSFFSWFISHFLNCLWNQRSLMSHTSLQRAFLAVGKSVWKQKLVRVFWQGIAILEEILLQNGFEDWNFCCNIH